VNEKGKIQNISPPLYFPQRGKIFFIIYNIKISLSLWERD